MECILLLEKDETKQKELLENILKYVNEKCEQYMIDSKLNFIVSETSKHRPLRKLMELDKSIYGIRKRVTDKDHYCRIDSLFEFKGNKEEDFSYIGKYQKLLSGGCLTKLNLSKNVKHKDILNIINYLLDYDIGFIKFGGGKYSYDN